MTRPPPDIRQRDSARAIFLCLAVLAQLLLPSMFERANAGTNDGCYARSSDSGKAPAHSHQECANCLPQAIALTAPVAHPHVAVTIAFEPPAQHAQQAMAEAVLRARPPPTGPPALAHIV